MPLELWKRALFFVGVVAAAALMAWQVSSVVDASHATAVHALAQSEAQNARQAAQAARAARLALAASRSAVKAQQLAAAIQASRMELCREQNRVHDNTLKALHRALRRAPHQRGQTRAERRAGIAAFVLILDAQTPHRNCTRALRG